MLKISRRQLMQTGVAVVLGATLPAAFAADEWPSKTVRLVVPFAAGGAVDQVARTLGQAWTKDLGQSVVVDNRPGAVGSIGATEVARSAPDGYTLLVALDSQAANHLINKKLPYDTFKSFDYLSLLVTLPQVVVVPAASPVHTLKELIELGRKQSLSYGTTGVASTAHQNVARLLKSQGLKAVHVPYKGAAPLTTDLIGGQMDFGSGGLSVLQPQIQAGKLRALAVSTLERSPLQPDVPMIAELVPGHDVPSWIGLVAPANLPAAVREKILAASQASMRSPEVARSLEERGFSIVASTPEAFEKRVQDDSAMLQELIASKAVVLD